MQTGRSARRMVGVSLLTLGCASTGTPTGPRLSPLLASTWQPPSGQSCRVLAVPDVVGDGSGLIDARAARDALARSAGSAAAAHAVVEVRWDSTGAITERALIESRPVIGEGAARALLAAVVGRLPVPVERRGGVLLRIPSGQSPIEVGGMEYCHCALLNRAEVGRLLSEAGKQLPPAIRDVARVQTVVLMVRSDRTGAIVARRLHRISPYPEVNTVVSGVAEQLEIAPTLLNRRPQDGWSRLAITFTFQ